MPSSGKRAHLKCKHVTRTARAAAFPWEFRSVWRDTDARNHRMYACATASARVLVVTHNGARLMLTTPFSEYGYQLPLTSGAHEFSYASGAPRARPCAMKPAEAATIALFFAPTITTRKSERPCPGPKNVETFRLAFLPYSKCKLNNEKQLIRSIFCYGIF